MEGHSPHSYRKDSSRAVPNTSLSTRKKPEGFYTYSPNGPFHQTDLSLNCNGMEYSMPVDEDGIMAEPCKKTPARAVFDDLSTAHSSITSQSAPPKRSPHEPEDPISIPLQELNPNRKAVLNFLDFPIPPRSAIIRGSKQVTIESELGLDHKIKLSQENNSLTEQKSSEFAPLREHLLLNSSTIPAEASASNSQGQYNQQQQLYSPTGRRYHSNDLSKPLISYESVKVEATKADGTSWPSNYHCRTKSVQSSESSYGSLPDSSTIGNIYRQYAERNLEDYSSHETLHLHAQSNPKYNLHFQRNGGSDEIKKASDLELRRLPSISVQPRKGGISRSEARSDLRSDQDISDDEVSKANAFPLVPHNPFRRTQSPAHSDLHNRKNLDAKRKPLEQDISVALRRASGYSDLSIGSSVEPTTQQSRILRPAREKCLGKQNFLDRPLSEPVSIDEETRALAAPLRAFYDQNSLNPAWIATLNNNSIRVPIHQSGPKQKITSNTAQNELEISSAVPQDDDPNDWETVGDSVFGLEVCSSTEIPATRRGTVQRAGSSIADVSDDGTCSFTVRDGDEFGSTDRIAKHPGQIHFDGNYRQRDVKRARIPIFCPVYGEHKINGYAADSTRIRPNPYFLDQLPLDSPHQNPFNTSPPEIKSPQPLNKRPYRNFSPSNNSSSTIHDEKQSSSQNQVHLGANGKSFHNVSNADGFVETKIYGVGSNVKDGRTRRPLPPGALYRRVRAFSTSKRWGNPKDKSNRGPQNTVHSAQGLRPLSYPTNRDTVKAYPGHLRQAPSFIEIGEIEDCSSTGTRVTDLEARLPRQQWPLSGNPKHRVCEVPTLFQREPTISSSQRQQKRKMSLIVLMCCAFFPPILILYGLGYFDCIIHWWSGGEFHQFDRKQKRWAFILLGGWFVVILTALVVFLVHQFSGFKQAKI